MKTKNLLLATLSLVVALGTAYASLLDPHDSYVRFNEASATDCRNVTNVCQETGTIACKVNLIISGAPATRNLYKPGCTVQVFSNRTSPVQIPDQL